MNAIEQALNRVPRVDGMEGAFLVEASTGYILGAVRAGDGDRVNGEAGPDGDGYDWADTVLAAAATDLVHAVSLLTAKVDGSGPLEEMIVVLRGQHHIIRPLPAPGYDNLFLLVTLDRRRANMALARHQLQALESQIVA